MKKIRKYFFCLLIIAPLLALFSSSTTSCNPHRRGPTAKQLGASGGKKYHTSPASAKRKRKRKY